MRVWYHGVEKSQNTVSGDIFLVLNDSLIEILQPTKRD